MKVAVGLSGGVDSSVAALLMVQAGHEVTGLTMKVWDGKDPGPSSGHSCYGPDEEEDLRDAAELCRILDIPFRVLDCSKEYASVVLDYFRREYAAARTPNPCVVCNQKVKFGVLVDLAQASGPGFDRFATGHYARVSRNDATGRWELSRARDARKDQTYFLHRLSQEQLAGIMFPLADLVKDTVREIARERGIPVHDRPESQDFYSGDYRCLLGAAENEGDIVMADGRVLGRHKGLWNFTPGQRRGLGIAHAEPLYVVRLDRERNAVVVGTREEISSGGALVTDINWIALAALEGPREAGVMIRSTAHEAPAVLEPGPDGAVILRFHEPQESVTPGQSAVFYDGDRVLGGGVIERALP